MLLISVKQQQQQQQQQQHQQQFISNNSNNNNLFQIHFQRDPHNFSKRIQFLNRFNESPLKLRKTQLELILIDVISPVISQLVAGINSTLFLIGRDHGDQSQYSFTHRFVCTHCKHG